MVSNEISMAEMPAARNTHQLMSILYLSYFLSQLSITHHAIGNAIMHDNTISFRKSFDNNEVMPVTLAPNTLRTPISFFLRSAVYAARPNKPRQEIKIARPANTLDSLPINASFKNILLNWSSTN